MKKNTRWLLFISVVLILGVLFYTIQYFNNNSSQPNNNESVSTNNTSTKNDLAYSYTTASVTFKSSVELKMNEEAGNNATMFNLADTSKEKEFYGVLFAVPEEMAKTMSAEDIQNYGKATYMGSTKPATEKVSRTCFEKTIEGSSQQTKIPTPSTLETYLITLPSNKLLFMGVKYSLPKTEADTIINNITSSMKEE